MINTFHTFILAFNSLCIPTLSSSYSF